MRKRTIGVAVVIGGLWWMRGGGDEAPVAPRLQAAVLPGGFAVLADRSVRELDRDAAIQHEMTLRLDAEVRFVGTRGGSAVGWKDGKKLKFALLDNDGKPDEVTSWGKKLTQLCDGAATNEHRFAVGWLESDGRLWFVHGPLGRTAEVESIAVMDVEIETAKVNWCGIASAEQDVALVWREGAKYSMNFCTPKQCSAYVAKVPLAKEDTLAGFGCVLQSCLFATRDASRSMKLHRVAETGRPLVIQLPDAASESVSIAGAGSRAFAIAYLAKDGSANVERVTVDGKITHVRRFEDQREVPALRWAGDKLLVAFATDTHAIAMPR
jgi:hypothetical protein